MIRAGDRTADSFGLLRDRRAGTGGARPAPGRRAQLPRRRDPAAAHHQRCVALRRQRDPVARRRRAAVPGKQNPLGKTVYDSIGQQATVIGIVDPTMSAWPGNDHPDWVFYHAAAGFRPLRRPALHGAHPARPARRASCALAEAHMRDLQPRPRGAFRAPARVLQGAELSRRPHHGDLPPDRDRAADRHHQSRHLRARHLQRQHAHQADRHAPRRRCAPRRHRALLPGRERHDHQRRHRCSAAPWRSATGYWLSLQYALPRLDLYYLVGGVLLLWAIGQLAAWQPARRAAAVSPSVATRTV